MINKEDVNDAARKDLLRAKCDYVDAEEDYYNYYDASSAAKVDYFHAKADYEAADAACEAAQAALDELNKTGE